MSDVVVLRRGKVERRPMTAVEVEQREKDTAAAAEREAAEQAAREQEEADRQAFYDAIDKASTLAELKKVFRGVDLPTQAEARHRNAP